MTAFLLDANGNPMAEETFTPVLVTKYSSDPKPLKPGYVEEIHHTIDNVPKSWGKKVRLEITSVEFADAAAK